ncbi:hypothetical protein NLX86_27990 [Streptomyces sp. A3M-1-3]|uniref:hypothetical protein n=1 Tax=Streptomyces sp. A3M-1-3 TaxID=2962044 RepID=UPI0020B742E8|nr:hypothetical protein [Streptomyces sp. A3M-1-3]MCP3821793.1 hypothetical protein [Streptomyces sp. A3M-1-3]
MWPGQQPPGGEQNPQDQNPNPYQQPGYQQPGPGYQQPNPYQQPGYQQQPPGYPQQPNPYQQPTAPQWNVPPAPLGAPQPPQGGGGKKTATVAIVAAAVVVVAAAVTGVLVFKGDDAKPTAEGDGKQSASPSEPAGEAPSSPAANPRDGSTGSEKPLIAGWKVVVNPKYGTAFEVPPEWVVKTPDTYSGFADAKKDDGAPMITMSAPAFLKEEWCTDDSDKDGNTEETSLAGTGTKGGQGAKNTAEAARNEAGTWVWGAYAQEMPKSTVKMTPAKAFTSTSGLKGHVVTATAVGVTKKTKCDSDGKSVAFTFKTAKGDFSTWVLYAAKGVKDEVPDATIQKILGTVRLTSG